MRNMTWIVIVDGGKTGGLQESTAKQSSQRQLVDPSWPAGLGPAFKGHDACIAGFGYVLQDALGTAGSKYQIIQTIPLTCHPSA
jgi:hypothetical protein